jgi:anaerobic selenocysteine-containing dehydrogenase
VAGSTADAVAEPDLAALKEAVAGGRVSALYVFDPGPEGSIGDSSWILDARTRGLLPLLIVQGVLLSDLARAADFVLPGASSVEKEASYTNDQGRLQGTARVIPAPGDAREDWQVLVSLASALGLGIEYASAAEVRRDIAARHADRREFSDLPTLAFGRAVAGTHWLQASNPSERWKWDFMFQDLPPIKGSVDASSLPIGAIPLKELK